jgi:hypothetical protein
MRIINKNSLVNLKPSTGKNITPDMIRKVQEVSNATNQRAALLGIALPTYYKYCKLYGISTKPPKKASLCKLVKLRDGVEKSPPLKCKNPFRLKRPLDLILQNKYTDLPGGYVKKLLIKSGIKEDKCEICGVEQVRECDGKTPLMLKFIDENKNNYHIENLQVICFNCNFLYYDEWSLKKIMERTNRKKMKCEAILKNDEGDATRNNQTCDVNENEVDSRTVGINSENNKIFHSYREDGEEETSKSEEVRIADEID